MKVTLDWKEYANLARKTVAEGCVLLRNEEEVLPIKTNEKLAVFGRIQFTYYKSGTGSGGMVNTPYVVSILDALQEQKDIHIDETVLDTYKEWIKEHPFDEGVGWAMEPWCQEEMPLEDTFVKEAAVRNDKAVIILGRTAGEDKDNSAKPGSYLLTTAEENMLSVVCKYFKKTIVVLNVGNIIDMKWVDTYRPQAVLYGWQGGMEGGHGVVDVLTGAVCPSGKLSDTIAYNIEEYPSTKYFGDLQRNEYAEDIYVGYRYFETIAQDQVQYPFGYGLSYTTFSYEVTEFIQNGNEIKALIKVTNTGNCSGKDTIQLYYQPATGKLNKPARNLIRFAKTKELTPGESQELRMIFSQREMASYDDGGYTGHKSCFVLEPGAYEIYVGESVRNTQLAGVVEISQLVVTEQLEEACAPVEAFERMNITEQNSKKEINWQQVPLRTIDLQERIKVGRPEDIPYTGNQGYQLQQVREGSVSMQDFLSQLTDEDMIYMTRGEGMCSPKVTAGIAGAFGGVTESLQKFGIPVAGCSDGPSGIRMDCGTKAFAHPNGTLLACTFNLELVEQLYEMEGAELRKNKIDTLLGPGINIHRNPLNGRNFEYFSEDPYLTGAMAVVQLKGMHKYGVTGTIKHFACNNQEVERHSANAVVSERALREIYLKAYEMCVKEADAYSIMSTYGPINGIWTAGNYDLLTTILRKQWGYQGMVMTDWWAKINEEEGEDGYRGNTIPMVRAQNDVNMVNGDALTNSNHDNSEEGLKLGKITRGELARNAENICRVIMRSPAMDFYLGLQDEIEEVNIPESDDGEIYEQPSAELQKELRLDISNLHTTAGSNNRYAIKILNPGKYLIEFTMKSDLLEAAQMNMSVYLNKTIIGSITLNGTQGKWLTKTVEFGVFGSIDHYMNLYFGQSGIEIGEIIVKKVE